MAEQVGQDVVLFGATGDLVMRKLLPALYHLHRDRMLGDDVSIIGIAREPLDTAQYREIAQEQCRGYLKSDFDEAHWQILADGTVERGGCLVETGANQIDASNATRWKRICDALAQHDDWMQ